MTSIKLKPHTHEIPQDALGDLLNLVTYAVVRESDFAVELFLEDRLGDLEAVFVYSLAIGSAHV